jgi:FkbM family methyltransferase
MAGLKWLSLRTKVRFVCTHRAFQRAPLAVLARLLVWKVRCGLRLPATVALFPGGPRLHLPARWRGVAKLLYVFRKDYEPELECLNRLLSPGMIAVDAGASYGAYTVTAARILGASGRVLSFEPASEAYSILVENIEINGFTRVRAIRAALADRPGKAPLLLHPDSSRNSLGKQEGSSGVSEDVVVATLDQVFEQEGIDRVDFLKLDVEGAEELVLRGARSLLERSRPIVLFEVNPQATGGAGRAVSTSWDFLRQMGYDFFKVDPGSSLRRLEEPIPGGNVFAIYRAGS